MNSVSRYTLVETMGPGTHLAEDRTLGRRVVLKFVPDDVAPLIEFLSGLDVPGMVPIHDLGRIDGRLYFAMKLVEGRSLASPAPRASRRTILDWMAQTAETLAAAHDRGIVHGPLAPSDVVVGSAGRVTILGWHGAKFSPPGDPREDVAHLLRLLATLLPGVRFGRPPTMRALSTQLRRMREGRRRRALLLLPVVAILVVGGTVWTARSAGARAERARSELAKGIRFEEESRWEEAREAYRHVLSLDPSVEEGRRGLDRVEAKLARIEKRRKALELVQCGPKLAEISYGLHSHEEAVAALRPLFEQVDQALALEPALSEAYLLRARMWEEEGSLERAEEDLNEAGRLDPDATGPRFHLGWLYLTRAIWIRCGFDRDFRTPTPQRKDRSDELIRKATALFAQCRRQAGLEEMIVRLLQAFFDPARTEEALAIAREGLKLPS